MWKKVLEMLPTSSSAKIYVLYGESSFYLRYKVVNERASEATRKSAIAPPIRVVRGELLNFRKIIKVILSERMTNRARISRARLRQIPITDSLL
jgi:hypothetical protein